MGKDLYIVGAGGHAKVVIEIAEVLGYEIAGVFDHNHDIKTVFNYTVSQDFDVFSKHETVFFALGNNLNRKKSSGNFGVYHPNLIHPSAITSKTIDWGHGNVVMAGVVINSSVTIGDFCIINTSASVDHDCKLEDFVHVSPKAALAGNVKVQEGAQIGIGACIKQNVTIGKWAMVGAGAVIIEDVPDYAVVVGNPGKVVKYSY